MERQDRIYAAAAVVVAAAAGAAVAWSPLVLLLPVAVGGALMLRYPLGRLLWLVVGGMIVLQSSAGITAPKVLYLAGVAVSSVVAWHRLAAIRGEPWMVPFRRVFQGAWVLAGLIVVWAVVGLRSGATGTDVARDSLTYALMLVGPVLAVDAAASVTTATLDRVIVGVSLLATVGWTTAWIGRRGVGTVTVNQFLLFSTALMAIGIALALVRGTAGERLRWRWLTLPPVILAGQLVTGTRTGLVLVLALFGAVGSRRRGRGSASRVFGALLVLVALSAVLLPFLGARLLAPGFLQQRLNSALVAVSNGWSADQSGSIRLATTDVAQRIWGLHPVLGVGFGAQFPDPTGANPTRAFVLDTSSLYLAKFGLIGTLVLAAAIAMILSVAVTAQKAAGRFLPEQAVIRAWAAVEFGYLVFGAPTEDKGFALTLPLLLALVGAAAREAAARPEPADQPLAAMSASAAAIASSRVPVSAMTSSSRRRTTSNPPPSA